MTTVSCVVLSIVFTAEAPIATAVLLATGGAALLAEVCALRLLRELFLPLPLRRIDRKGHSSVLLRPESRLSPIVISTNKLDDKIHAATIYFDFPCRVFEFKQLGQRFIE